MHLRESPQTLSQLSVELDGDHPTCPCCESFGQAAGSGPDLEDDIVRPYVRMSDELCRYPGAFEEMTTARPIPTLWRTRSRAHGPSP